VRIACSLFKASVDGPYYQANRNTDLKTNEAPNVPGATKMSSAALAGDRTNGGAFFGCLPLILVLELLPIFVAFGTPTSSAMAGRNNILQLFKKLSVVVILLHAFI
jgi:hypothetical protein